MNTKLILLALASAALTVSASAAIVDFEDLNNNGTSGFTEYGDQVNSGGYNFASVLHVGDPAAVVSWTPDIGSWYSGSVAIFANFFDDSLNMTKVGGGAFNLTSLMMGDVFLDNNANTVIFTGTRADNSTVVETVVLTTPAAMTTYNLSLMTNIVSLNINDGTSTDVQLDNLNVAPVPEPASMAALGLGVAALIRRRRAAKA